MNRTMRCAGVGLLFFLGFAVAGMQAQQSANAEPQAPSSTGQAPREAVPALPVPRLVKFAGVLTDELGKPRAGTVGVTFAIYKEQEGGAALWVETQNVQLDEQGHYGVLLGVTKNEGLPVELFATAEPRWLGVQLAGEAEQPRVLLVSVPYALRAADAENLGGRPASAYALAGGGAGTGAENGGTGGSDTGAGPVQTKNRVTAPGGKATPQLITANFVPVFTDSNGTLANSLLVQGGNSMALGQGLSGNASVQFDVNGGIRGRGLATGGRNTTFDAINTNSLFLNGSNAMAVIGASNAAFAPGVLFTKLSFFAGNGTATAERMTIDGTTGSVGIGTSTPTDPLDVIGPATNVFGQAILAVGGSATTGTAQDGIDPTGGNSTSGFAGFGVFATGGNATAAGGVAGDGGDFTAGVGSNGATNGFAGFFSGDVHVTGAITAGTKDFKIDHPLDPTNKYLVHASVESSEMLNIYTGNATLDATGSASVSLPGWFETVNKDFRYQLTAVGAPGPNLYIAQEIQGGRFVIAGGQPGMKVSWQVTGVRQDAFAKAHPLIVEEEKPLAERGYYIHPELYGAPEERGIGWARHPQLMKKMNERRAPLGSHPVGAEAPQGSTKH